ncbi:MAG: tetratricopeptide repeat protein [Kiritimatiellae bacterium]|nr:tetratricopeptide repeat protein [Kiritimatiellia bacterium]
MSEKKSIKWFDAIAAFILAAIALIIYYSTTSGYAFPNIVDYVPKNSAAKAGEGALVLSSSKLIAAWRGFAGASQDIGFPLTGWFARRMGAGNYMMPLFGALATVFVYLYSVFFFRRCMGSAQESGRVAWASRIGGFVATAVFMVSPALRAAATHLEPRLIDLVWAFGVILVILPFGILPKYISWILPLIAGFMVGVGLCDSALFLVALPLFVIELMVVAKRSHRRPWVALALLVILALSVYFIAAANTQLGFKETLVNLKTEVLKYFRPEGWRFVLYFTTLPFIISLFAAKRSLREFGSWTQWIYHSVLVVVTILAIATPLAPSALMASYPIFPVVACAFAALTSGYIVAFWWVKVFQTPPPYGDQESKAKIEKTAKISRFFGYSAGGIFAAVALVVVIVNLFSFDTHRGDFADLVAEKAVSDLDGRKWLITDGSIDEHLLIAINRLGSDAHIISLARENDPVYIEYLRKVVEEEKLGGANNASLLMSLELGILPFIQDWLESDPDIKREVAVWGAADLLLKAGLEAVPEFLFFGADSSREVDIKREWQAYSKLLDVTPGKGSLRNKNVEDPLERSKIALRRHIGLIANNRGVWLADKGRKDEAFDLFELVLNEIDPDNVCALFNECELVRLGERRAVAKSKALDAKVSALVKDKMRYRGIPLSIHYGYIRSPEIFVRLGIDWVRSGRPGEALLQFGRAMDLIPNDRRTSLMNLMASLYAVDNDREKSRKTYEMVLSRDSTNHEALIGMMRLELIEGNIDKAIELLEKANAASGDDPRALADKALLFLLKKDYAQARELLRKATEIDSSDMNAWSLFAATYIQQIDDEKDSAVRSKLMDELENSVVPSMEKHSKGTNNYQVQNTKAFILLKKGAERRKEARDAFLVAARTRPEVAATGDMILGLDISLNDTVDAERQAREMLRRDRKAPLANYVMGSLKLQKGEYAEAEAYLRISASAAKPVPLALNDLAEVLRRSNRLQEAEGFARKAVEAAPNLYVAWDTLATIILQRDGDLDEAERCVTKACELSKGAQGKDVADIRMLMTLAKVQLAKGRKGEAAEILRAKANIRKVKENSSLLSEFEKRELEELEKSVQ